MQIDLSALGLSQETIEQRIVDEAVDAVINGHHDHDGLAARAESLTQIAKGLIAQTFAKEFDGFCESHLVPRIHEMLETMSFPSTNQYGEKKQPPLTLREFIDKRVSEFLTEDVDSNLKARNPRDSFGWTKAGSRLNVIVDKHIQYRLQNEIDKAFSDLNKTAAEEIQNAVRATISRVRVSATAAVK